MKANEFKKWWCDWIGSDKLPENTDIIYAFEAGQQSQQAKIDELQARVDDLNELNRLKDIALQQSVNRTSIHVHEKIVALENKLKGNKDD